MRLFCTFLLAYDDAGASSVIINIGLATGILFV